MAFGYCRTNEALQPVPLSNKEIANEERFKIFTRLVDFANENQLQLPFSMPEDEVGGLVDVLGSFHGNYSTSEEKVSEF